MGFAIGMEEEKLQEQAIRGVPHKVAADCWFTSTGKMIPRTVLIRNEHLKTWGKDLNTVFSDARKNTPRVFPAELTPMSDFLQNAFPNSNEFIDPDRDCVMKSELFILSNAIRQHGAICTLYDDIMNQIGKTLQDDFFVIPSSVHEVLLLKASDTDCMELNEIIREVNETTVIPEEILSDHAYFYSRDRKELLCA